jgi:hypothetical protein
MGAWGQEQGTNASVLWPAAGGRRRKGHCVHPIKALAHKIGALYFVFAALGVVGEFVLPKFMVAGDAAATTAKITAGQTMYRVELLNSLVTLVMFIVLVALLHKLFKDVDATHAVTMVLLVCVGVAVAFAGMLFEYAPLVLLGGADYFTALGKPQLDALVMGFLRLNGFAGTVCTAFWGLWLFPFGILVNRSRYFPRILGYALLAAGVGYVVTSVTSIALPEYRQLIGKLMMPLYFGELPIIFWMLIRGAKVPVSAPAEANGR